MLLIPIAQENSTVRRTPWVSAALIGINVAVFFLTALLLNERQIFQTASERFAAATAYLAVHPYLEVPPNIDRFLDDEDRETLRTARADYPLPPDDVYEQEQAELVRLDQHFQDAFRDLPFQRFGFIPVERRPSRLLTSMFIHADWLHLLGNMLFLFLSGPFIEDLYGRGLFLVLYLLGGVMATLTHSAHDPASLVPLGGASGAVAAVMGAFLVRLGASRIRFLLFPLPPLFMIRVRLTLPAFVVLPLWLGQQLVYAQAHPDAGVAWWAHIGGFAFGAAAAAVVKLTRIEETWIHPSIEGEISIVQHPSLELAADARAAGDHAGAKREIQKVLSAEPENVDAWTIAHELALDANDGTEIGRSGQRLLDLYARDGEVDLALSLIATARREAGDVLPARFCLSAAGFLERQGDARAALELCEAAVARSPEDPAAFRAHMKAAEILRRAGDPRRAREAFARAREHPACPDRASVDQFIAEMDRRL